MNLSIKEYLKERPDLIKFLRYNPEWYRYLSRDPNNITDMETEAKIFYGKTFTQRLEKFREKVQLTSMLINMTEILKD